MLQILTNKGTLIMQKAYLHNIRYGLDKGYEIAVVCPEEGDHLQEPTTNYNLIKDAVESTGYAEIIWLSDNGDIPEHARAYPRIEAIFVAQLGLEPDETIMDFSCTPVANEWENAYYS